MLTVDVITSDVWESITQAVNFTYKNLPRQYRKKTRQIKSYIRPIYSKLSYILVKLGIMSDQDDDADFQDLSENV